MHIGNSYNDVFIVGTGESEYSKDTSTSVHRVFYEAIDNALKSAKLTWNEIDGLAATSYMLGPDNVTTLLEHFGISTRWLFQGAYGGASPIIGLMEAARAIQSDDAEVVVCAAADVFDVSTHNTMIDKTFSGPLRDYLAPFAFGGANGVFAMQTRNYMARNGAASSDFVKLLVAQRENALLNPNALFKRRLTLDDYRNSRQIADPLRIFDCVLPCSGGNAIVVCSAKVAGRLDVPVVKILGAGQRHNYPIEDVYSLTAGWEAFSDAMYTAAGYGPSDMNFAQLYDDYPVMECIQLEGLHFARRGEAFKLLRSGCGPLDSRLPINTGGGQLSAGQAGAAGGMLGLFEAVTQLRGDGGARQLPREACHRGIVSGYGMVAYGRGLSTSAVILSNEA